MTSEAQRIAIAEVFGWKVTPARLRPDGERFQWINEIPDYLNDLNAMHEAEKELTKRTWPAYHARLVEVFMKSQLARLGAYETHATAAHRAEAFLRTIGKWVEP